MSERPTPTTADWARRYIDTFGLALVPIDPGEKGPKGSGWNQPGGYFTASDDAATFWSTHPSHNLGVVLGPSRVCSLDVDDVQCTRQILQELLGMDLDSLADAYPTSVGNPARFRIMFKMPEGVDLSWHPLTWPSQADPDGSIHKALMTQVKAARDAKDIDRVNALKVAAEPFKKIPVFELRAGLVQDVLPPSIHPGTGRPYTWRTPPDPQGLPELPAKLLAIWQDWENFKPKAESICPWQPKPKLAPRPTAAKPRPAQPRSGRDLPDVIPLFNQAHDIASLIEGHGYERRGDKWLCPQSSSGMAGVSISEGKLYSHHSSDPLANGHKNDAFDVFCILVHGGDQRAAIKAAAEILGIDAKSRAPAPPPLGELPRAPLVNEQADQEPPRAADTEVAPDADREPAESSPASSSDGEGGGGAFNLKALLRRYALIEGTTQVWDIDAAKKVKKAGFIAHIGKDAFKEWEAVTDPSRKKRVSEEWVKDNERTQALAGKALGDFSMPMMTRYVYIDGTKDVWDYAKKRRVAEGAVKMALGDAYSLWLNNPDRRVVDMNHIVFDPCMKHDPQVYINTFEGLPLEPVRNDAACENLRWLINFLCNEDEVSARWLTCWLAYPLQHSGAKMDTAVLMHSTMEGSGKSLLFSVVMGQLYGIYSATVGQTQLEGNFNAWQSGKLWAVFEEVVSRDQRYNQVGKIKQLITGQTIRIESKFVNGWEESSHMNAVFLSNEIMPWPIGEADRRFLVMWPEHKLPPERQLAIKQELLNGGVEALYGWLLAQELGDFDPQTKPPSTPARERLVALSRASWQTFVHLWRTAQLGNGLWGACLSSDLYSLFLEWCQRFKEHSMSQTKFSLFIETVGVEKTRAIPWTEGNTRRFSAWFFPKDDQAFLPPSMKSAELGAHVLAWRSKAKLAGWNVDGWDHVKGAAA
ncbi:bifunctional DNA primase/polymerase [Pseudomonas sp. SC11]|uniref:bifunctional DNA primase/polymerase n=1 Tax=Pseudomonas sp. SC11 TaxID=326927 RepID=UPI00399ABAC3